MGSADTKLVLSANQRLFETRANNFWHYDKHRFRKVDKFVEIWHLLQYQIGTKFRAT